MYELPNALFGNALIDHRRLRIFTLADRRARHFSSLRAAMLHATKVGETKGVFGVAFPGSNFSERSPAADIVAICGLWADIDIATWSAPS